MVGGGDARQTHGTAYWVATAKDGNTAGFRTIDRKNGINLLQS